MEYPPTAAPETTERPPRPAAFRLDLLTDDEIRVLSRLITEVCDSSTSSYGEVSGEDMGHLGTVEEVLHASLEAFSRDYPERAVPLFRSLLKSDVEAELDTATLMAPGIASHSLELAVDGLLATQFAHRSQMQGAELAMMVLGGIGKGLPADQRTWFDAKLALWEGREW
jgi:hypothetical protein